MNRMNRILVLPDGQCHTTSDAFDAALGRSRYMRLDNMPANAVLLGQRLVSSSPRHSTWTHYYFLPTQGEIVDTSETVSWRVG